MGDYIIFQNSSRQIHLESGQLPIFNNEDDTLYAIKDNMKIYNSAILVTQNSSGYSGSHMFIFKNSGNSMLIYTKSGGSWVRPPGTTQSWNSQKNTVYATSNVCYVYTVDGVTYPSNGSYMSWREGEEVLFPTDIPIFYDRAEFANYVCSPYVPPPPGATVKVSYYLPDDTYTYSKLTYNSEHEPEDKDDGTSIDILPSNTSVNVEDLQENTLYYFTIFTNKSESSPFPFVVGEPPIPPHPYLLPSDDTIFKIRQNGNATGIDMTIGQIKQSLLAASSMWQTPFSTFVLYNGRTTSGYYVWGFSAPLDGDIKLYDKSGLNERYSENPNIYYITAFEYVPRHSFANRSFYQFILKSNSETELEYTNYNTDINSRTSNVEKKEEGEYIPGFEITNDTYLPVVFVTNTQNFTNVYINDIKVN